MKNILAALAAWVPTIQTGATEAIAVLNEIKAAATATGEWADEHETVVQSNPATATPAAQAAPEPDKAPLPEPKPEIAQANDQAGS